MRNLQQSLGFGPPSARRGILPLLLPLAIGTGRAIYGAIQANQEKQRRKGYINKAYERASRDLTTQQSVAAENSSEALAQRGLLQGGALPPIHAAATGQRANSLAGQIKTDEATQMGYERTDLDEQRDQASRDNRAAYSNAMLDSAVKGVETGANVYGAGKDLAALSGGGGAPAGKAISGGPDGATSRLLAGASFGGIHPVDPLGDESSAWHPSNSPIHRAIVGDGQPNYGFQLEG